MIKFIFRSGLAMFVVLLVAGISRGENRDYASQAQAVLSATSGVSEESIQYEESETEPDRNETHTLAEAYSGYRFFSVNRNGGSASQYEYLHSGPVYFGLLNYLSLNTRFSLEGGYLNDNDYHGELVYDYKGILRLTLRTESLFHNLSHVKLFDPPFLNGGNSYQPDDLNPRSINGVRVEQDLAQLRYKPGPFPLHLNLGYWRMFREGTSQMIFADHSFEGPTNSIYSKARVIDRQTHEGQFGFDTHLGFFDLIYDFRVREFKDHTGTPRDNFSARLDPKEFMPRNGGLLQHDDTPDSRFYSHKLGLHTSMSGGLVGAVSYVFGKRENLSGPGDVRGADQNYAISHNVAGDLTYTPCGYFSVALKYRRIEIDRNTAATIVYAPALTPDIGVRPAVNTEKDTLTASFVYRPAAILTIKGEYKGEFLTRDNLNPWVVPGRIATLSYPEHSDTQTGSLTFLARPLKGLRALAQYLYSASDHAVYASSYEEKHEGLFQLTYMTANSWGMAATTRISRENSDHVSVTTLVTNPAIPVTSSNTSTYQMPNNKNLANATMSGWFVPLKNLTVTGTYGLLRSSSEKSVLFAGPTAGSNALSNYTQQSQIFSVSSVYHFDEKIDVSLGLQQVRSYAEFNPQFISLGPASDTGGIQQVSAQKTIESSLSTRADYRLNRNVSCAVEYAYKDIDDKNQTQFNGSVNTIMLYLSAKW